MKLRRLPEDFQVEEVATIAETSGRFALYELQKRSIGTPEAIAAIGSIWKLPGRRIAYGGLKDKHAVTSQFVSIQDGPHTSLQHEQFLLSYLRQCEHPYSSRCIDGNRFTIVMRDLSRREADFAVTALSAVEEFGLPNYFDNQRFGSLGFSGEWIAAALCRGDYERALWLALADPHPDDSSTEKQQKQILRDHWGQWVDCQKALSKSHRRSIITFLSDKVKAGKPADVRGAFARISPDLRGLYLSAWQSAIWNRVVSRLIEQIVSSTSESGITSCHVELKSGPACFPLSAPPETVQNGLLQHHACEDAALSSRQLIRQQLSTMKVQLPSARIPQPDGAVGRILAEVLNEEGLCLKDVRVKSPRDCFFSRAYRSVMIMPEDISASLAEDELYPGRLRMTLRFELPPGSYATILVKQLTSVAQERNS
ncbi:MAG: tRNA pseudouridine(13) synthase TruD [Planctomycetaceae bacterium]